MGLFLLGNIFSGFAQSMEMLVAALLVNLFLKEIPLRAHHVEPRMAVADQATSVAAAPEPFGRPGVSAETR